ncbi:MAG: class I SAM-dependent methyltransferase [Bacteroidia bacterium]|jgi:ubiquinone/menaquinone biosynthesis C-methylase UbiE
MAEEILYDRIGTGYNTTRKADPYIAGELIRLLDAEQEGNYLDIGCGTGNYTSALYQAGIAICGVDPSDSMLEIARKKHPQIDWKKGTAEAIPFPDQTFDGIIGTLTIHHWSDLKRGFGELGRVLKPKGKIVLFTSTPEQMKGYWLNHYFPDMLQKSIEQMPEVDAIQEALSGTSLTLDQQVKYFIEANLQDQFMYIGKEQPEIYFNEIVRNGISSFANLAHAPEVKHGLEQLKTDIQTGKIQEIMSHYKNDKGDYLFMCINKP